MFIHFFIDIYGPELEATFGHLGPEAFLYGLF